MDGYDIQGHANCLYVQNSPVASQKS